MSVPRVPGYQLHPRCSLRRENVIRINNSSHPLPHSLSIRIHTIPPSSLPFAELFPMALAFYEALCPASLRNRIFPTLVLSLPKGTRDAPIHQQFHELEHACSIKTLCVGKFQTTVFYYLVCPTGLPYWREELKKLPQHHKFTNIHRQFH